MNTSNPSESDTELNRTINGKGRTFVFLFFIGGLVWSAFNGFGHMLFVISACGFFLMLLLSAALNVRLRREKQIEAEFVFAISIGGIVTGLNMILYLWYIIEISIPLSVILGIMFGVMYEYIFIQLIRNELTDENIYVQKHPKNPQERYYIFLEEQYIPLIEEAALEEQEKNSA